MTQTARRVVERQVSRWCIQIKCKTRQTDIRKDQTYRRWKRQLEGKIYLEIENERKATRRWERQLEGETEKSPARTSDKRKGRLIEGETERYKLRQTASDLLQCLFCKHWIQTIKSFRDDCVGEGGGVWGREYYFISYLTPIYLSVYLFIYTPIYLTI